MCAREAAASAIHKSGLPGRPPEQGRPSLSSGEARSTGGPVAYIAIAFASRDAAITARLRVTVAELAPDARVVRSRAGVAAAVRDLPGPGDARAYAESLRSRLPNST